VVEAQVVRHAGAKEPEGKVFRIHVRDHEDRGAPPPGRRVADERHRGVGPFLFDIVKDQVVAPAAFEPGGVLASLDVTDLARFQGGELPPHRRETFPARTDQQDGAMSHHGDSGRPVVDDDARAPVARRPRAA